MKNKKKNKWLPLIIVLIVAIVIFAVYSVFNHSFKEDKAALSLNEKQWIEKNKNTVIDMAIINNVPVFGQEGEGIFFSFLDYFEQATELEFNRIPYTIEGVLPEADYAFKILDADEKIKDSELLFYEDNYVMVSRENRIVSDINNLGSIRLGMLQDDIAAVSDYLSNNESVTYTPVNDITTLLSSFENEQFDYIVVPKNAFLNTILEKDYYIGYLFNNLTRKYVLSLTGSKGSLNSIITKHYKSWTNNNLSNYYNQELFQLYCSIKNIDDKAQTAFQSKEYIYGYLDNLPYEGMEKGQFIGINSQFTNSFSQFALAEFTYKGYSSVSELNKALKDKKVDIAFNYYQFNDINDKAYYTIEPFYGEYVILSNIRNNVVIDSVKSLKDKKVASMADTYLTKYALDEFGANVTEHKSINRLLRDKEALILLDKNTYKYYKNTELVDYVVAFEGNSDINYNYIITKTDNNELFYYIFQYYLSGLNHEIYKTTGINNVLLNRGGFDLSLLWLYLVLVVVLMVIVSVIIKKRKAIKKVRRENKTKYIDPLTSLKNRYYLQVNMQKWEDNTIYPQAIVIIDLNSLKDINDNYGHDEGDRLIKMAANIIINNQLENTDIVRTDGNEFTIYMVGYDEVKVSAYIKKLNRLFKDLPYERGASLGYSMIEDDIKTIDDAINEAVLDMVTNKETNKEDD